MTYIKSQLKVGAAAYQQLNGGGFNCSFEYFSQGHVFELVTMI